MLMGIIMSVMGSDMLNAVHALRRARLRNTVIDVGLIVVAAGCWALFFGTIGIIVGACM